MYRAWEWWMHRTLKSENVKEWDHLGNLYVEEDNIKMNIKELAWVSGRGLGSSNPEQGKLSDLLCITQWSLETLRRNTFMWGANRVSRRRTLHHGLAADEGSPDGPMTASSSPGRTTPLTSRSMGLLSTATVTPLNTNSRGRCWSRHGKWIVVLGTFDSTLKHKYQYILKISAVIKRTRILKFVQTGWSGVHWTEMVQDRDVVGCCQYANELSNSTNTANFLTIWATLSCSRMTVFYGVS